MSDENVPEKRVADSFYIPKGVFLAVLVVVATVVPQAIGLSFARSGTVWDGKKVSAATFFSHFDLPPYVFFLVGFIPCVIFGLFFIIAALWPKIRPMKYLAIALFGVTQFIAGFAYTRVNFQYYTRAAYHDTQAYKVNAINVGVISVLLSAIILFVAIIILLIFKKRSKFIQRIYSKRTCVIAWSAIIIIVALLIAFTPILQLFGAMPLVGG